MTDLGIKIFLLKEKILQIDEQHRVGHQSNSTINQDIKVIEKEIKNTYEHRSELQLIQIKEINNINNKIKRMEILIGLVWLLLSIPVFNLLVIDTSINYFITFSVVQIITGSVFTNILLSLIKVNETKKTQFIKNTNNSINEDGQQVDELMKERELKCQLASKTEASLREIEFKRAIIENELTKLIIKQSGNPDLDIYNYPLTMKKIKR